MLRGCVSMWAVHPPTSAKISTMKGALFTDSRHAELPCRLSTFFGGFDMEWRCWRVPGFPRDKLFPGFLCSELQ